MKKTFSIFLLIFTFIRLSFSQCTNPETPYKTLVIPGTIEAEDYDNGCNGIAYYDLDALNYGGKYRTDAVDILTCSDLGGGYMISRISTGEWLKYTVNVDSTGLYKVDIRVSSTVTGAMFHIEFDSVDISGSLTAPNTSGAQVFTSIRKELNISAGKHIMKIYIDKGGFNLNNITFSSEYNMSYITIDNAVNSGLPLEKKFDLMNSGNQGLTKYTRGDVDLYGQANIRSLRIDWGWGTGWSSMFTNMISGSASNINYDFFNIDFLSQQMKRNHMGGYWSYGYCPNFLQTDLWANQPNNLSKWREILKNCAAHFKQKKLRPDFQAVWNEPDLKYDPAEFLWFYTGTLTDYIQLYDSGIRGLMDGDPEGNIGGPDVTGIAGSGDAWMTALLDHVKNNNLRLDFFSFHNISGSLNMLNNRVDAVRSAMKARGSYFDKTEILCTELITFGTNDARLNTYECVPGILDVFRSMIQKPDFTRSHWAQGTSDDLLGLINTSGYRRASYFAFKFYGMMPLDQKLITGKSMVNTLASGDDHNVCLLTWNTSGDKQKVMVKFKNVPFNTGMLEIHKIDNTHNSFGNLTTSEGIAPVVIKINDISTFSMIDSVINNGTVLYKLTDGSGLSEQDPVNFPVNLIHRFQYFPERTKNNFAMFDKYAWIARLGMNNNDQSYSICGHSMDELPPAIKVKFETYNDVKYIDKNSLLGLRVDYEVDSLYTKGVLFHGTIFDPTRDAIVPWGTEKQADEDHLVNLSDFTINFAQYAPAKWTGKIILSFIMQNTGANTSAKIRLIPAQTTYAYKLHNIPGIIDADDFDLGGENYGYHDTDTINTGGLYRQDVGVDIGLALDDKGAIYTIDSTVSGEWLHYTVNVLSSTKYVFQSRVSSNSNGCIFHILLNDSISSKYIQVPNTGGKQKWQSVYDTITLSKGIYVMTVMIDSGGFNFNRFKIYGISKPYKSIIELPGTIETENFNINGYYDKTTYNSGFTYRLEEPVDIALKSGRYYLIDVSDSEWVEYSVHVAQRDSFDITTFLTSNLSDTYFTLFVDDSLLTTVNVPNYRSLSTFKPVIQSANLDSGMHTLRFNFNKGGYYLDKFIFALHVNGLHELNKLDEQVLLYPNPASGHLTIETGQLQITDLSIRDVQGREVYYKKNTGSSMKIIEVNGFQQGIYFVKINMKEGAVYRKLIIQK